MPLLLAIPLAVFAGVLIVVGWDVVTAWRNRLLTCPREDIAVGVLVGVATLWLGTVPAVLFGVVSAMLLYVRNTSRAPLRGHYDAATRPSARIRTEEQARHLRNLGPVIRVIEVQGSLFFGTAHRFGRAVEGIAAGCRHLILDMQRVHEVDPTGALVLTQTMRRLGEQGVRTAIAAVSVDGRQGTAMVRAGLDKVVPPDRWFEDVDRALEQAEDLELKERWPDLQAGAELPLAAMDICRGLSAAEIAALARYLQRTVLPAGTALFNEGDAGRQLYLLARGAITVSVRLDDGAQRSRRLGTFSPGVMLGEIAVIEGTTRSADAVAVSECVLYALDGSALERMRAQDPELHGRFMLNLARNLAGRLRHITQALRAASS
jgi:CRP-like cAMP-binding protein/anti-anti-sigma regulatory factor